MATLGQTFGWKKGEVPANRSFKAYDVEDGDLTVNGTITCYDLNVTGNVVLSTGSIVDVFSGTVYSYGDPVLLLNSTFTSGTIAGTATGYAGLEIDRGASSDNAVLAFSDGPSDYWRMGYISTGYANMDRVVGLRSTADPTTYSGNVMVWTGTQAIDVDGIIYHHAATDRYLSSVHGITVDVTSTATSRTLSSFTARGYPDSILRVSGEASIGGSAYYMDMGTVNHTVFTVARNNVPTIVSNDRLAFMHGLGATAYDKLIFDDLFTMGDISASTAVIRSQRLDLKILTSDITTGSSITLSDSAASTITLEASALNISDIASGDCTVNITGSLDVSGALDIQTITAEKYSFTTISGFNPLPTVGGPPTGLNDGTITYDIGALQRASEHSYVLTIKYDNDPNVLGTTGHTFSIPLRLSMTDDTNVALNNIRSLYGVARRRYDVGGSGSGSSITQVYPIPAANLWITEKAAVTGYTLVQMAGYKVLNVTVDDSVGYFELVITVVTAF